MKASFDWIRQLELERHPEGGYFREIYRNSMVISGERSKSINGKRNLATSIYFLLETGENSKLHRLKSDEIWYFHDGSAIEVHVFYESQYFSYKLGRNFENGEQLQVIIPAGAIFGAEVLDKNSYTIVGCMVAPGFHFDDFELIPYQLAINTYPQEEAIIRKLT